MKKFLPSLLLSFFSLPLSILLYYIYFWSNLPGFCSFETQLISTVISLNTISLILALNTIMEEKLPY